MPHNGGRCQINATMYGVEQYFFPTNIDVAGACGWQIYTSTGTARTDLISQDYVDQTTWEFLPPPGGSEWWTNNLRAFGKNGDRWVVRWTGTCNPTLLMAEDFGLESTRFNLVESAAGRRVYEMSGVVPTTLADVADRPPENISKWAGRTGEYGFSILCRLKIQSQTTPVRIYMYRLSDEADFLAGRRHTREMIACHDGIGVLRFMAQCGGGSLPGATEWNQYAPPSFPYYGAVELYKPACYVSGVTEISENYFDIPLRAGKPSATDCMQLQFHLPSALKWKRCQVSPTGTAGVPAGKTRLTWTAHGLSNGDFIIRCANYWQSGGDTRNGVPDNGGYNQIFQPGNRFTADNIDPATGLRDAFYVTVVDANTLDITFDSSGSGLIVGDFITFMKPPRLRYGGQTYWMHLAEGRWWMDDTTDDFVLGRSYSGCFVTPVGKTISSAHFVTGIGWASRLWSLKNYIDLCNETGSHIWLTICGWATPELIDSFATYVRDNLAPGLEAWFELGNEYWQIGIGFAYAANTFFTWQGLAGTAPTSQGYWSAVLAGDYARTMGKRVKAIFAGSGKTAKFIMCGQAGAGTFSEHDVFLKGLNNYPPGEKPGDLIDAYGIAPYNVGPQFGMLEESNTLSAGWGTILPGNQFSSDHWYLRKTGGPPGYTKGSLQAFIEGDRTTAFNIARDSRLLNANPYFDPNGTFFKNWKQVADTYGCKIVQYEGGIQYWKLDQGARALGFTNQQIAEWWWHWRRSTQFAEIVAYQYQKWFDAGPQFECPSWFIGSEAWSSPRLDASSYFGFNWGLRHFNSPEGVSSTPGYDAFMLVNDQGNSRSAYLSGRGYLTATLNAEWGAAASLSGGGVLSATAEVTQQQFVSGLTDYGEGLVLNYLFRASATSPASVYLALHNGSTGEQGATNEVSGGDYVRKAIAFDAPSGGATVNSGDVAYDEASAPWGDIVAFSLWDADTGGNCLATGAFTGSKTVSTGDKITVPAGGITITAN